MLFRVLFPNIRKYRVMTNLESDQKELVKYSLLTFLENKISDGNCLISDIDEIVLNYVINVLEDMEIDKRNYEEQFDAEGFTEIMGAYFPGFAAIDSSQVCDWLFTLADQLVNIRSKDVCESNLSKRLFGLTVNTEKCQNSTIMNGCNCSTSSSPISPQPFSHSSSLSSSPVTKVSTSSDYHSDTSARSRLCRKGSQVSERQHKSSHSDKDDFDDYESKERLELGIDKELEILQEMFPNVSLIELTHCISVVDRDTEKAAQLIMHRLENKESLTSTSFQLTVGKMRGTPQNDKDLKAHILSRYAFVDEAEDVREHKPVAPKTQPKKLIRYRNNKIVSIKGEKFTEPNGESD